MSEIREEYLDNEEIIKEDLNNEEIPNPKIEKQDLNNEEIPNPKIEKQDLYDCVITCIFFIIQGVILPIMYINNTTLQKIGLIKLVCIVGIIYYILQQTFFSETDDTYIVVAWAASVLWVIFLIIGGLCFVAFSNMIDMIQLLKGLKVVISSIAINTIFIVIIAGINELQEEIINKAKSLKGYKQKEHQIIENTKYFLTICLVLAVLFVALTLISKQNLSTINWEKLITYLGTPYCIIILGILLRRD